jgi:hypothetical protein
VADTDTRSIFANAHVEAVVYCSFHDLNRGYYIILQLTMVSRQSDSANRAVVYSIMYMR